MNLKILPILLIIVVLIVGGCAQQQQDTTAKRRVVGGSGELPPSPVIVKDQAIKSGTVTVEKAVSTGPGWISIRVQADGAPGNIIGYAAVKDGENSNIAVTIDAAKATTMLYAVLHKDKGIEGKFEFPGADSVVTVGDVVGEVVAPAFKVTK